ncbi:hypothetical protein NLX83_15585 [Allokutzneria sp. A3M-2-11 16]|uniref:MAB_1171c family putative transporter n=1 Tax=Allokutzneria sp. A3M-2-11 16 TaxID=2962043 RepID=UPI0020B86ADA|nr:MAB_1171c family putative transporter [Allokutzneria sp. A3M-2-11 16]MCP3800689.1 hypothetical protein [Allokutzneria sp. A3M-2-11 16]
MPIWMLFAGATLALVIYKFRVWRHAPADVRSSIVPVCTGGLAVAAGAVLVPPSVGTALNNFVGIPSLSVLLLNSFTLMWACSAHAMLLYWRHQPQQAWRTTRWIMVAYGAVIATETMLFFLGAPEEHHKDFTLVYADAPWLGAMLAVHYSAYSVAMGGVVYMCWRWSLNEGTANRAWLRRGLRITAVGLFLSCAGTTLILIAVLGRWHDAAWSDASITSGQQFSVAALPLVIVGMTISAWGPHVEDLRDYQRLRPLWRTLRRAALPRIRRHRGLADWTPESLLMWRMLEINDWLHRLHHYCGPLASAPTIADRTTTSSASDRDRAMSEAARIRLALDARRRGATTSARDVAEPSSSNEQTANVVAAAERSWLVGVSQALHSRRVDALVRRHRDQLSPKTNPYAEATTTEVHGGPAS